MIIPPQMLPDGDEMAVVLDPEGIPIGAAKKSKSLLMLGNLNARDNLMAMKKKTWREKVDEIKEKIHVITPDWEKRYGKGKLLIAKAVDIERLINKTKAGQLLTNNILREKLAKDKNVQVTDPITVGIFLRIIAEAAEEERVSKKGKVTPYWRVLKPDGAINIKLPGGAEKQMKLLKSEGHKIEKGKGKKPPKVVAFETLLKKFR